MYNGVAGVGAPIVPNDDPMLFRHQINDLSLGFIAPLQTNYAYDG